MIDMHTHLDLYPNSLELSKQTNDRNNFTLSVTTSPRAWIATARVFSSLPHIKVALGMHPEIAFEKFNELDLLISLIPKSKFIGEVGLDGSSRFLKSQDKQELIFDQTIMECQKAGGRIISIHSRAAVSRVLSILRKYPSSGNPILHWFSGSITELKEAIEMKCFFSVNPVMIKSKKGKDLVSRIPYRLVLPESDGPFNTHNGKPIMPWEAMTICEDLEKIWGIPYERVKELMLNNLSGLQIN